ncbi:MAG: T9SS type A sorting domain-containing protein [Hymenobacter sp.]|nr:MAG: T9SS type A sorting domain-containing protein [Hymenobacter sp.]
MSLLSLFFNFMTRTLLCNYQSPALLLCLFLNGLLVFGSHAQAPAWQTAQALAAAGTTVPVVLVQATATDASGNVYIAGQFSNTLQLGAITLNAVNGNGFVAKWSPATNSYVWAQAVGNDLSKVAVSGSSVYVAGDYTGTSLTVGSTTLANYDATGNTPDLFVAKYTDAGTSVSSVWAQRAGGLGYEEVNALAVNGSAVYVAGSFRGAAATFGSTTLPNAGGGGTSNASNDLFVARLTDAGSSATYGWALRAGGTAADEAFGLAVSGGSVYVAGGASGTASFGSLTLTSAGALDAVVAKINDGGTSASYTWAQRLGGTADDEASSLVVSGSSLYVAGIYANATLAVGTTTLTNVGSTDAFVAKLTDAGTSSAFVWAQNMGSTADDAVLTLAVSQSSVYLAGYFGGRASAGRTLALGSTTLTSAGSRDVVVARLLDAGSSSSYVWGQQAGGPRDDLATSLTIASGRLYVGGEFLSATATFGSFALTNPGGTTGDYGGFLASLADPLLATRDAALQAGLSIYPNPAQATATVQVPAAGSLATLTLLDGLGRVVRTASVQAGTTYPLDLAGLAPGVYALRVQVGEKQATRQLVVE